jgi:hypothetical protein
LNLPRDIPLYVCAVFMGFTRSQLIGALVLLMLLVALLAYRSS